MPFDKIKSDIINLKRGGFNTIIRDAIKDNANIIVKMNTEDQLYNEGIDKYGVKLKDYRPRTKQIKQFEKSPAQPVDRTTLRDTGDFHKSYFLKLFSDSFQIESDDEKRDKLFQKYGSGIFGLTQDNMRVLRNILKLEVLQQIRKRI